MFKYLCIALLSMGVFGGAFAGEVQIQLRGELPARVHAELVLEDTLSTGCRNGPCTIDARSVVILRNKNGIGVMNVSIPSGATRICLQGMREVKMVSTVLHMNNKLKHTTRRGFNIHENGSGGCSKAQARIANARIWIVDVE